MIVHPDNPSEQNQFEHLEFLLFMDLNILSQTPLGNVVRFLDNVR